MFDSGAGGLEAPAYGTPVYAMEDGTVGKAEWRVGPLQGRGCRGSDALGNYLEIASRPVDGYTTLYVRMLPLPEFRNTGAHVHAGDLIGSLDSSGCERGAHLHVARKDGSGRPVNFTLWCVNPMPPTPYDSGIAEDDVPDALPDDTP